MAKGDDAILKKKNKAVRKRARRAGADTAEAVQGTQEHRRRRKLGTRRVCESMCYSLPSEEDPFNDKGSTKKQSGKRVSKRKRNEEQSKDEEHVGARKRQRVAERKSEPVQLQNRKPGVDVRKEIGKQAVKTKAVEDGNVAHVAAKVLWQANTRKPPSDVKLSDVKGEKLAELAFQMAILHSSVGIAGNERGVGDKMKVGGELESLIWRACGRGQDVLAACGDLSQERRLLAYVPPAAAHILGRGLPAAEKPVALVLLPSQDRVLQARQAVRHLKKCLQISSLGLHTGTAIERQTEGLSSQSPEIILATPDRLCELFAMKAVRLGSVSYLVVDGLDGMLSQSMEDQLNRIVLSVHSSRQMVVLSSSFPGNVVRSVRLLMKDPVTRVTSEHPTALQSACITQSVSVVVHDNMRLARFQKIVEEVKSRLQQSSSSSARMLVSVKQRENVQKLFGCMAEAGLNVEDLTASMEEQDLSELQVVKKFQQGKVHVLVLTEAMLSQFPLTSVDVANVILYDFPSSMTTYSLLLKGMARETINGRLYSICSGGMAPLAAQLVQILQQCSQAVPPKLELLVKAVNTLTSEKKSAAA